MTLLSRDFFAMATVANLVAWPLAYYATRAWLDDLQADWPLFVVFGVIVSVAALGTVMSQSKRAADRDTVEALASD